MPPSEVGPIVVTPADFTPSEREKVGREVAQTLRELKPGPNVSLSGRVRVPRVRVPQHSEQVSLLVSTRDRTLTNANGRDPMEFRRAVSLLGPLARTASADKRASFAGTFITQNERPNRQQRQAMKSKRFGHVRRLTVDDYRRLAGRAR